MLHSFRDFREIVWIFEWMLPEKSIHETLHREIFT
jgi:hypothetical protein